MLEDFQRWLDVRRLRKAARLVLKATQGESHCKTVQMVGRDVAEEVQNLTRWVHA